MAIWDNMPNDRPGDDRRRIADLERKVRELSAARTLDAATITPAAGMGIRTGDFDGTDFANPGTVGNYFGGDGAVLNALYLRPGSVTNDALTAPVVPGVAAWTAGSFAVAPGAYVEKAGGNVTVPLGCTRLQAQVVGTVFCQNTLTSGGVDGTGTEAVFALVQLGTTTSGRVGMGVSGSGGFTTANASMGVLLEGLTPGATLRLSVLASSSTSTIPSNANSSATVNASLSWLR